MSFIEMKNICKKYAGADKNSVTDFSLSVEEGEFIAFVGPSGCGKSTTLRMIAGFEEITSGDFYIDGKRMNAVLPRDRGISMVFQNYALYPHMTVEKNISYGLKNMKVPAAEIKKKVDWAIDILGLSEYRYRKPKNLSGGQRQRVALGRAIVKDQKLFLMDEPLSNLDAKLRVSMRSEISKLHRKLGSTTIFSDGSKMQLPESVVTSLNGRQGTLVLGIRGEDIKLDPQNLDLYKDNIMSATVDSVEVMGNENNLYFNFGGTASVARVSKYEISKPGDTIDFAFVPSRMHFFDTQTEESLF